MFKNMALVATLSLSSVCHSDTVVFNNFTQTYGYSGGGVIIGGPSNGSFFDEFAMSFIPISSGYLSDVYLAFYTLNGTIGDNFNLWLSTDNAGLPDAQGTSINFNVASSTEILFGNKVVHLNAANSYFLNANETYWLGISSPEQGIIGAWSFSSLGTTTEVAERNLVQSEQWAIETGYPSAAFSVSVNPVPVPPAIILFLSGLMVFSLKLKKA